MKQNILNNFTALLAATAALVAAPLSAEPAPPPATLTFTDSVAFGLGGTSGASGTFDQISFQESSGDRIYFLSSIQVTWTTTTNTTSGRILNDSMTTAYTVTGLTGQNTFSLLTENGGSVFSSDINNWSASVNTNVATAPDADAPRAANTSSFSVGTADSSFTLTAANGALFQWFIGTGEQSFWLNNVNTVDTAITSTPPNTNGDLTAFNRSSTQSASGNINFVYTYSLSAVPEASSMVMGSFGLLGLVGAGFVRRRRAASPSGDSAEEVIVDPLV
jgi:MYXO-CTERM domain-containing protein